MYEERTTYTARTEYVPTYSTVECRTKPNVAYIQTLPGMLKILVIVLNILVLFCVAIGGPGYYAGSFRFFIHIDHLKFEGTGWATFVSTFGLAISLLLLILYLFQVVDMMPDIPWIVGVSLNRERNTPVCPSVRYLDNIIKQPLHF